MPINVTSTPLMSADIEHLTDQVIAALPFPYNWLPRKMVSTALGHIIQFVPPDLVQILISSIDGLSDQEIQQASDIISQEVVNYIDIPLVPEHVEWQMISPVVTALLTYAVSGKSLTLWRPEV